MAGRIYSHPICEDVMPRKMSVVRGMITELYYIPFRIREIDSKMLEIRECMDVRGVNYDKIPSDGNGSTPNDTRLANMITDLKDMESERLRLMERDSAIRSQLHWLDLPADDMRVVEAVYTTGSYYDAGKKIGYSKIQIYRKINEIYRKLARYV